MSDAIKHIRNTDDIFLFQEDSAWCTCIITTQSNSCGSLDFLSLKPCPQQSRLNALTTRSRESYSSVSMSRESNRQKKSRSDWLNSGNALIQHLSEKKQCDFHVSPLFQQCRSTRYWGGIVKCLLIAYPTLSVTFLPKNVKTRSRTSKL